METQYTLAIVIPCWNSENHIRALIESICNQSFSDWNAFFIDDGCTDNTPKIIEEYTIRESRIHYSKRETLPKGAQKCRNLGILQSKGAKYIIFFDSDDLIAPFCFEQRVKYMQANPYVDFASFPAKAFKTDIFDETYWGFGVPGKQELILSLLYWKTLQIIVFTNIYKRDSIINANLNWDESLGCMQDADFNIQALTKGFVHSFAVPSRIDYFYRTGHSSVSKRIADQSMHSSHVHLIEKVIDSFHSAYGTRYDFHLKAFVVNYLALFGKNRLPIKSILRLRFVKANPVFYLKLLAYLLLGMRGRNKVFRKYVMYSFEESKQWSSLVTEVIRNKTTNEYYYE